MNRNYHYLYKPSDSLWTAVIEARDATGVPFNRIIDASLREYLGIEEPLSRRKNARNRGSWSMESSGTGF